MIGLRGIRLDKVEVDIKGGEIKTSGKYSLVSTTDKVLATQGFNSYSDIIVELSADTHKALGAFLSALKLDVDRVLGLNEQEVDKS